AHLRRRPDPVPMSRRRSVGSPGKSASDTPRLVCQRGPDLGRHGGRRPTGSRRGGRFFGARSRVGVGTAAAERSHVTATANLPEAEPAAAPKAGREKVGEAASAINVDPACSNYSVWITDNPTWSDMTHVICFYLPGSMPMPPDWQPPYWGGTHTPRGIW